MGEPAARVDRAFAVALVATADAVRDEPPADAQARLQAALQEYQRKSDAWAASRLSARRKRPPTP